MQPGDPAKLLRIHITEGDRFQGRPLYEAIVARCREMGIAGATVFRGHEGYGETAEIHKSRVASHDRPILVTIVDSAENVNRLIAVVEAMMDTGLLALSDVTAVRVQKSYPEL
jgi:PII-like signaling protein